MKQTYAVAVSIVGAIAVLIAVSIPAKAQVDTGAVSGTVTDQSGAVVPGALVTLTSEGTLLTRTTTTGSDGTYTFVPIGVDTYTVTAEKPGFKKEDRLHIHVDVQEHATVNFLLTPGEVTQRVEVTAPALFLQTQNASIGQVVGSQQINDLPLNGRIYVFLAQLSAGVTVAQQDNLPNAGTPGMAETGAFSANGANEYQNNFMLDGIDNNNTQPDNSSGWGYAILPPIDGLAEFKIQTSDFSPEFGRAGGAVINAVTKSGTNQFHGDLWEFVRNDKFDSADFFENASNSLKGEYRQNQFGGTLGGPLKIPGLWQGERRAFFFADYEGLRVREGFPQLTTVPTFDERGSGFLDLSDLITLESGSTPADNLGRVFPFGTVFNPATTRPVTAGQVDPVTKMLALSTGYVRDPFAGNLLPSGQVDSHAVALLNLYPNPTAPGLFNNFFINTPESHDSNQVDARMDLNVSDRNQMFLRGNWYKGNLIVPPPFQGVAQGGGVLTGNYLINGDSLVFGDTQTYSPTLVNESRLGFIRQIFNEANVSGGNTLGIPQMYGIQGIPQYPGNGGLPFITIGGLNSLGPQGFIPIFKDSNIWDARDDLTKIRGAHTLKFGVTICLILSPIKSPHFLAAILISGEDTPPSQVLTPALWG